MKAYLLIVIFIFVCCFVFASTFQLKLMPELKRNVLNFCYRINFKYDGMLAHYIVTKFILLLVNDINFSPIDFNAKCSYLNEDLCSHQMQNAYF